MYTKTQWVDNTTPIDKDNLNKIEQGIYDNSLVVDAVTNTLNPTDTETYKTAELTEGQITDVIGVSDIVIKGQTSQNGEPTPSSPVDVNVVSGSNVINTSNKNLFNYANDFLSETSNGITITRRQNGTYSYVGTATGDAINIWFNGEYSNWNNQLIENALFKISSGKTITAKDVRVFILYEDLTKITLYEGMSLTLAQNAYIMTFRAIQAVNGTTYNKVCYPQLEISSTATTYEPHQGKELPLDLPVENLFNPTLNSQTLSSGTVITKNSDNSYTMSKGSSTADLIILGTINVKEGEIYYLSDQRVGGANNISLRRGGSVLVTTETNSIVKYTSTATETLNVYARYQSTSDLIYKPMISTKYSKTYTPYGTDPIELCKIGDYQDYFYRDGNDWYLHKEIIKNVFNGTENDWNRVNTNIEGQYRFMNRTLETIILNPSDNGQMGKSLNNLLINQSANYNYLCNDSVAIAQEGSLFFYYSDIKSYTISEFRNWLTTHNLVLYCVLKTPTNTKITDSTLKTQLEAIYNAPLYEQTNITQTNNDLPMVLDITACKDNINGIKAFIRK